MAQKKLFFFFVIGLHTYMGNCKKSLIDRLLEKVEAISDAKNHPFQHSYDNKRLTVLQIVDCIAL